MEERGSEAGYLVVLIFGIIFILIGLSVIGVVVYKVIKINSSGNFPEASEKTKFYAWIAIGFYIVIMNVWIVASAFWMRYFITLRRGYITCSIVGLFSLNVFVILGGIIGIIDYNYLERMDRMKPKLFV